MGKPYIIEKIAKGDTWDDYFVCFNVPSESNNIIKMDFLIPIRK
jgi:hypothetical protein